jgi:protein TonB
MIGAGGVTALLLGLMTWLIADEFQSEDSVDFASFEINPKPDDIPLLIERTPPKLDAIDVPPPPPVVDILPTDRPSEPIIIPHQPDTVFDPSQYIVRTVRSVIPSDTDPKPLIRVPPIMPPRASRSGHCQMLFDIGSDGKPFNIAVSACSDRVFERPAIRAVGKWVYRAEVKDGLPVTRTGLTTIIRFRLTDDRGDIIPE